MIRSSSPVKKAGDETGCRLHAWLSREAPMKIEFECAAKRQKKQIVPRLPECHHRSLGEERQPSARGVHGSPCPCQAIAAAAAAKT
jgi:hypothetical protein